MNIFYLDSDPVAAAKYHCDKHVVKMIVETAQMLSTAHFVLDGELKTELYSGRIQKKWSLKDKSFQVNLYTPTHANHPSSVWVRENRQQYMWAYELFCALLDEYTARYDKVHASERLRGVLCFAPQNIVWVADFTAPPLCIPDQYKSGDPVQSYRDYYRSEKAEFAKWKCGKPRWWKEEMKEVYEDNFASWDDVQSSYSMKAPKPEAVLYAQYSYEDYRGHSEVLYYDNGKYWYNTGSHCSCYGLEGQWEPEPYTLDEVLELTSRWGNPRFRDMVLDHQRYLAEVG